MNKALADNKQHNNFFLFIRYLESLVNAINLADE